MLNLTPHAITIRTKAGDVTFPPSGRVARVVTVSVDTGLTVYGARVIRNTYGPVAGLPRDGAACIVSGLVLAALPPGTPNVFAPGTGATAIRENGQIVAVTELVAA